MADERTADQVERSRFGPNTWLLDELYARYLIDPSEVSEAWREFFDGYRPQGGDGRARRAEAGGSEGGTPAEATAPPWVEPEPSAARAEVAEGSDVRALGGAAAVVARRMEESLAVPTATSIRTVPAKLLELNRRAINRYLERGPGGRVSLTHVIAYAIVRALEDSPAMRRLFGVVDGKPSVIEPPHIDLGIAVDVERKDGSRTLLVPTVREAETLDFTTFVRTSDDLVRRARDGTLAPDELAGATVTITNPGTLGTGGSVPRLMAGQSAIVGVGAIAYPAEFAGTDPATLAELGISTVVTLTSTYDHRVIQGAESGAFLRRVEELLRGEHGFYGEVFDALEMPHRPIHWTVDARPDGAGADEKQARVLQLINNYRVRGHLIADLDPLATVPPETHPDLDPANLGFTIWDLDRTFPTGGLAGTERATLAEIWDVLRDAYCGTVGVEYMHIQ
ncbi:MAG TPA: 2-oxo acid dehydrogenase subunit E2, partial [Actinomycetota bacterium]|nr:2-oxo acid dehydrogenase subunit E2 [Actinomycetota bacterium]